MDGCNNDCVYCFVSTTVGKNLQKGSHSLRGLSDFRHVVWRYSEGCQRLRAQVLTATVAVNEAKGVLFLFQTLLLL